MLRVVLFPGPVVLGCIRKMAKHKPSSDPVSKPDCDLEV